MHNVGDDECDSISLTLLATIVVSPDVWGQSVTCEAIPDTRKPEYPTARWLMKDKYNFTEFWAKPCSFPTTILISIHSCLQEKQPRSKCDFLKVGITQVVPIGGGVGVLRL